MQGFYRAILKFYPAEYRAAFAPEMIDVFDEASKNFRKRGLMQLVSFASREFAGLMKGLVLEHTAKLTAQDAYVSSRCTLGHDAGFPSEVVEVQHRLKDLIRSMEFAIAHHDFPKARFYSNEERITRVLLERMIDKCKLHDPRLLPDRLRSSNECA